MPKKYEQYVINRALRPEKFDDPNSRGFSTMPPLVFMKGDIPVKTGNFLEVLWIWKDGVGGITPGRSTHKHDWDEVFVFLSSDHKNPDGELGADIEFCMGDDADHMERYCFNTSTSIYVPRGVCHLPIYFKNVKRPVIDVTFGYGVGSDYSHAGRK